MDIKCVINTRQLRLVRTGVADKPKALPNWLRANLRKLVELYIKVSIYYCLKASSRPSQIISFEESDSEVVSLS